LLIAGLVVLCLVMLVGIEERDPRLATRKLLAVRGAIPLAILVIVAAGLIACAGGARSGVESPTSSSPLQPKTVTIYVQAAAPSIALSPGSITVTIP
jgi:hypothetical protein